MITLCNFCNTSHSGFFEEGKCYLCEGKSRLLPGIARESSTLIKGAHSFSLSTKLPRDILIREEKVLDYHIGSEALKSRVNSFLIREIKRLCGASVDNCGEVSLMVDFEDGKVSARLNDIYVFGRYKKLARGISQTRWPCPSCLGKGCPRCNGRGKLYLSVEEMIGEPIKKEADAEDYVMHASGREDIDVLNLYGRPFVIEIKNPKRRPSLEKVEKEINSESISVSDLKIVRRGAIELVSSSHFDKVYEVEVEFKEEPDASSISSILSLRGRRIRQKTPKRVAHRRAKLIRKRKILDIELISRKKRRCLFRVKTEAGTYMKELVTGDEGRTDPSFSSLSGTEVRCVSLKVVKIEDAFLDFVLGFG